MIEVPKISDDRARFFAAYARFEFALKETGYIAPVKGIAYADWPRFANDPSLSNLYQIVVADKDVQALVGEPPKSQLTLGDRQWYWGHSKSVGCSTSLLLAVKQVRDNLFHGGKQGENPRDDQLCRAGWEVIRQCLLLNRQVRDAFEGRY